MDSFYKACVNDTPILKTIILVDALRLHLNAELWITSGRSNVVRKETVEWINKYKIYPNRLLMRPQKDNTPDDELKASWIDNGTIPINRVFCVFEDRQRVVDMWRSHDIQCYQVAEGNF